VAQDNDFLSKYLFIVIALVYSFLYFILFFNLLAYKFVHFVWFIYLFICEDICLLNLYTYLST